MLSIAICDDNANDIDTLVEYLYQEAQKIKYKITIHSFDKANVFYEVFKNNIHHFDLVILDIEMPEMDGLEIAKKIREYDSEVLLIFVTSYSEYVFQSFEYKAFRYIPKEKIPYFLPKALYDAIQETSRKKQHGHYMIIENSRESVRFSLSDIVYVDRDGKYVCFHAKDKSVYRKRDSLKNVMENMQSEDFLFINKGFVINMKHCNGIANGYADMEVYGHMLISRKHAKSVREFAHNYWSK